MIISEYPSFKDVHEMSKKELQEMGTLKISELKPFSEHQYDQGDQISFTAGDSVYFYTILTAGPVNKDGELIIDILFKKCKRIKDMPLKKGTSKKKIKNA